MLAFGSIERTVTPLRTTSPMNDLTTPPLPSVHRTEIDGVPTLWSPAPGQLAAGLVFRIGRADEAPIDGGISHVVEHLAMVPVGLPRYECNASVEGNRTVFMVAGSHAEVVDFLGVVTRTLTDLPLDRLEREWDILRREADERGGSIVDAHRHLRYGMWSHGLPGEREFGLGRLSPERIAGWSLFGFTRQNAMLWLTGEPPADLRLALPDGVRRDVPAPRPVRGARLPAIVDGVPGVGFGFELAREIGAGTFMSILHRRLRQRLRMDDGVIYDLLGAYEPLDASRAVALLGSDCEPSKVEHIAMAGLDVLDALVDGRVEEDELADEVRDFERTLDDPTAVAGLIDAMVSDELVGMPPRSPADRLDEQRRTDAGAISTRAAEARRSLILLADLERPPADLTPFPRSSAEVVAGREIKPLLSVFGLGRRQRLTIGPDGVTLREPDGTVTTIRYADMVILEKPAEDELVLWDLDGDRIYIPGIFWRGGSAVLAEIEAAVPPSIVIEARLSDDLID
jgi:hypothetical protein